MFDYHQYANLCNGEIERSRLRVWEEITENDVHLVFVSALTGSMVDSAEKRAFSAEAGVCISMYPKEKIVRFMSDFRKKEFWCTPAFGTQISEIPGETQLLVLEMETGEFCTIVPVVNDSCRCVLKGTEDGCIEAQLSSWCEDLYTCDGLAFVYMKGKQPGVLIQNCVKASLKAMDRDIRMLGERRYPDIMEYLGWCSWDSMQIRVDEAGVVEKCEEFKEKNIPVKWAILDDMWAEIRDFYGRDYHTKMEMFELMHRSAMWDFEADPIRFPNGLKGCVEKVNNYGIKMGIWHPTTGYWRGIAPESKAFEKLKKYLLKTAQGYYVADWHKEKSYGYYKTMHDFFRKCGIEFVKIDNQSMCNRYYRNQGAVGVVAREYHDGMEASVGEHFDNCMINCMGMSSEDMWSRSVSPISRCSDDFKPEDAAWFTKHVMQCAYNSLLQGQFYWCDWDMWWTDDSQAEKNSLMRAVSGGPIYVSDMIGRSRAKILEPLALKNGKILRCDRPAIPTADCVTRNPAVDQCALKIQNMAGEHGIMAVLNINDEACPVIGKISAKQIDGFEAEEYVVYDYFDRSIRILKGDESFEVTLENKDQYKLYIFAPLKDGFAVIGRIDKFISPKTVQYVHKEEIVLVEDGPYAYVKGGKLCIKD